MGKTWFARSRPASGEWTAEQTLHLALAGIAVMGWTLAYTALMRGVDPPQDRVARHASTGMKISSSLTAAQTPATLPSALPSGEAAFADRVR